MENSEQKQPAFNGFSAEVIEFLRDLKANNNREWFTRNKASYSEFLHPQAARFAGDVAQQLADLSGRAVNFKIFRIYRDVRFSKDKTPYNSHIHMRFWSGGHVAWFFALEPDEILVGAGAMKLDNNTLSAYRVSVSQPEFGETLGDSVDALVKQGFRCNPPEMRRYPVGFTADHRHCDLLRHKSLTVWRTLDWKFATSSLLASNVANSFYDLLPFNDYLQSLLGDENGL